MSIKRWRLFNVGFFCLLSFASAALAFEEPDNFRGIKWGASPAEARQVIREQWEKRGVQPKPYGRYVLYRFYPDDGRLTVPESGLDWFGFRDLLGDADVRFTMKFLNNRFVHAEMEFDSGFLSIIQDAFEARYGPPTSKKDEEIQNRAGARFINRVLSWSGPTVSIRLEKYSGTVTNGRAWITQQPYVDYLREEQKKKAAGAAKDL